MNLFDALAILVCLLGGMTLVGITTFKSPSFNFQLKLFVLAFAIRFGVSFALYQLGFVSVIGDDDATGWQGGALLADHWSVAHLSVGEWLTSVTTVFSKQNLGYQYFLGIVFYFSPA